MWSGQIIGDYYARRVVGASRSQVDGVEMPPLLSSSDVLRTSEFVQQRVPSATFSAVDDATPGGQARLLSIQGSDRWHEDFYGIPRLNFLQNPAGQAPGQKYTSIRYGGSLGGPIRKGSTHFVAQYLGIRQSVQRQLEGYIPSADYRAKVQEAEPGLASILSAYPTASQPSNPLLTVAVFDSAGSQTSSGNMAFLRFDQTRSRKTPDDSFFARFNMAFADNQSPLSAGEGYLRDMSIVHLRPFAVVLGWMHPFNVRYLQDLHVAWMRSEIESRNRSSLNSPYSVSVPGLTSLSGNQETFGSSGTWMIQYQVTSNYGRHTVQAGAEMRRIEINLHSTDSGRINFASLSSFSANHVNWATYTQAVPSNTLLEWQTFAFLQDSWKLRKNLLVGAGFRYEFYNRLRELLDKAIPFDFATCGNAGFCPKGASFNRLNLLDLDPRVSIALTPSLGPSWFRSNNVLRAGAAIYHSDGLLMDQASPVYNEVQNFYLNSSLNPELSYPVTPYLFSGSAGIASARGTSRDRPDPYAAEWSVSLQTQLSHRWILTDTYFGAHGVHLPASTSINLIDPLSHVRPYPAFGQIPYFTNTSSSSVHVAAFTVTYAAPRGAQVMGGYNWAHEIDNDADADIGPDVPQNPACARCERSSGDFDIRHLGGFRSYYPLHFGGLTSPFRPAVTRQVLANWSLLTDFYGTSPLPVNVTIDRATSSVATGYTLRQRPDRVPGVRITPAGGSHVYEWINPQAFTAVHGLYGTAGRNIARGPVLWTLNSGLQRDLLLPKRIRLRVQARSANVLNHANYSQPFADWSSPQFGEIITPYTPQRSGDLGPRTFYLDMSVSR